MRAGEDGEEENGTGEKENGTGDEASGAGDNVGWGETGNEQKQDEGG